MATGQILVEVSPRPMPLPTLLHGLVLWLGLRLHLGRFLFTVRQVACECCEPGFYCRHRCRVHPKPHGLEDSGQPWRTDS